MHRILERQLKHAFGSVHSRPTGLDDFLKVISDTYAHFDEDRALLDRSLEISSKEYLENSKNLVEAKEQIEKLVEERTQELHKEHATLVASINSLSIGLVIIDPENSIIMANDSMRHILNIGGDASGIAFKELIHSFEGTLDITDFLKQFKDKKISSEIKNIVMGNKQLRLILSPVVLSEDPDRLISIVMIIEDVTGEKMIERSREEFFSIASHELRTPLTAIRGNASILMDHYVDKMSDPDMKQIIDDIFVSSERLIRIVNDFLSVSRLEQGKIEFRKVEFDIVNIIEGVLKELELNARKNDILLKYNENLVSIPFVHADQDRMKQVLINLIGNAINHSTGGSVIVSTQVEERMIRVSIMDTGVGISPQNQALLFRKFQQAGSSIISRDATGTGLGLYISKLLVEGMGGEIMLVKSAVGKGSTFAFTVPVANISDEQIEKQFP